MGRVVKSLVFLLLLAGGLAAGWYWYQQRQAEPTATAGAGGPPGGFAVPVEAQKVLVADVVDAVEVVGSLLSDESVMLRPEIAGRITRINFTEGQPVKQGTVLVELDDTILRAQLTQAQASLTLSEANNDRAADLLRRAAGTVRARDEAVAAVLSDRAAVALAQAQLDKTKMVAPFDGVLGLRRVSVGDYVEPGRDLVNIEKIDSVKVDFRVPEVFAARLAAGQPVALAVDALPDGSYEGEVYAIDPQVDVNGRAVRLRARAPNVDGRLRPGMFARIRLTLAARKDAIQVPEEALVPMGAKRFVFRVVDGKAALTPVETGLRREGRVEIVKGLGPEDVVVTAGQLKLRDQVPVKVMNPAPEPQTAARPAQG